MCTHHTAQAARAVTDPGAFAQTGGRMPETGSTQVGSSSSRELSSEITLSLPGTEDHTLGVQGERLEVRKEEQICEFWKNTGSVQKQPVGTDLEESRNFRQSQW